VFYLMLSTVEKKMCVGVRQIDSVRDKLLRDFKQKDKKMVIRSLSFFLGSVSSNQSLVLSLLNKTL